MRQGTVYKYGGTDNRGKEPNKDDRREKEG